MTENWKHKIAAEGASFWLDGMTVSMAQEAIAQHQNNVAAGQVLKTDKKRIITRVEIGAQTFVVKEYLNPRWLRWFSQDYRGWCGHHLIGKAAKALALKRDLRQGRAWIILEDAGTGNLYKPDFTQSPEIIVEQFQAAGKLLAELHENGIYHADTKTSNFVTRPGQPEVIIIDCDDVRQYSRISLRHRMKNLAQFCGLIRIDDDVLKQRATDAFLKAYGAEKIDWTIMNQYIWQLYSCYGDFRIAPHDIP